jgi:iron complex transport system permease protein
MVWRHWWRCFILKYSTINVGRHSSSSNWIWFVSLLMVVFFLSLAIGSVSIAPDTVIKLVVNALPGVSLDPDWVRQQATFSVILWKLRLPHALLMLLVGAALGGSGAAYQGLFHNPLADPYLIGVASGAGLGAVAAMSIHFPYSTTGLLAIPLAAFCLGIGTVWLVYTLARVGKTTPTTNLILAGVAVSAFATALTSFFMLRSQGELHRALAWLLGGGTLTGWQPVIACLPYILSGLGLLLLMGYPLNVLQFGDEQAQQLGISVNRVRWLVVAGATLATAGAVAFSGIIGFVGLVVPHVFRLLGVNDYRKLLPVSMLGGAVLLIIADLVARVVIAPQQLPVGLVTAMLGAPFFLWVLKRAKSQAFW